MIAAASDRRSGVRSTRSGMVVVRPTGEQSMLSNGRGGARAPPRMPTRCSVSLRPGQLADAPLGLLAARLVGFAGDDLAVEFDGLGAVREESVVKSGRPDTGVGAGGGGPLDAAFEIERRP